MAVSEAAASARSEKTSGARHSARPHCGLLIRSLRKKGIRHVHVNQVLVISPEKEHHERITVAMNKCGLISICCVKLNEARIFMDTEKFGVVFCHETLPDGDFHGVLSAAKSTPVVVLSRFAEWDHYLAALRAGAFDYIACPPDSAETERILWSAIGNTREIGAFTVH